MTPSFVFASDIIALFSSRVDSSAESSGLEGPVIELLETLRKSRTVEPVLPKLMSGCKGGRLWVLDRRVRLGEACCCAAEDCLRTVPFFTVAGGGEEYSKGESLMSS